MMITNKLLIEEVEELKIYFHKGRLKFHLFGSAFGWRSVSCMEYALRCN